MKPEWACAPVPKRPRATDRVPEESAAEVIRRSGGWCECSERCTDRGEVIHHRLLRSQGGGHEPSNLLHLSVRHHLRVHANPAESYAQGLLIRRWETTP